MGLFPSKKLNFNINKIDTATMISLYSLLLTDNEIEKLFHLFHNFDLSNKGIVKRRQLFASLHIESSLFSNKLFKSFPCSVTGEMNFCHFVCSFWNLLSIDASDLPTYIFYLYDHQKKGFLEFEDIKIMVETLQNKSYNSNISLKKLVASLTERSSEVHLSLFLNWSKSNLGLFSPIIGLHHQLRSNICGNSFWEIITVRRSFSQINFQIEPYHISKVITDYYADVTKKNQSDLNFKLFKMKRNQEEVNQSYNYQRKMGRNNASPKKIYPNQTNFTSIDDPNAHNAVTTTANNNVITSEQKYPMSHSSSAPALTQQHLSHHQKLFQPVNNNNNNTQKNHPKKKGSSSSIYSFHDEVSTQGHTNADDDDYPTHSYHSHHRNNRSNSPTNQNSKSMTYEHTNPNLQYYINKSEQNEKILELYREIKGSDSNADHPHREKSSATHRSKK